MKVLIFKVFKYAGLSSHPHPGGNENKNFIYIRSRYTESEKKNKVRRKIRV